MARGKMVNIRLKVDAALRQDLELLARKSGWTLSDQIRFELLTLRGKYKPTTPFLPQSETPMKKSA